jgi:hypothetical protein
MLPNEKPRGSFCCEGAAPALFLRFPQKTGDALPSPSARRSIVGLPSAKFWSLLLGTAAGTPPPCSIAYPSRSCLEGWSTESAHSVGSQRHGSRPMIVHPPATPSRIRGYKLQHPPKVSAAGPLSLQSHVSERSSPSRVRSGESFQTHKRFSSAAPKPRALDRCGPF